MRDLNEPSSRATTMPPTASMRSNSAQAALARSSVSRSTAKEPPAGSTTLAPRDSGISRDLVFRPIRRATASGTPRVVSEGIHVKAPAPPPTAENKEPAEDRTIQRGVQ